MRHNAEALAKEYAWDYCSAAFYSLACYSLYWRRTLPSAHTCKHLWAHWRWALWASAAWKNRASAFARRCHACCAVFAFSFWAFWCWRGVFSGAPGTPLPLIAFTTASLYRVMAMNALFSGLCFVSA
jgi:hypothetical protein